MVFAELIGQIIGTITILLLFGFLVRRAIRPVKKQLEKRERG